MIFNLGRKSERIVTADQLASYLRTGTAGASGIAVTPSSALQFGPVFACVRVRAESLGQLPAHLLRVDGAQRTKATDHPLYELLHTAPNDYMTAQEFRELISVHLDLRGNFYAYVNRVRGAVRELLPLQPDAVTVKQRDDLSIVYDVTFADGSRDVLEAKNVLHVKGLTLDGVTGLSVIGYARESIALGIATERHGAKLFANGAKPGGVLATDKELSDEAYERIKESWNEAHRGVDNAHKVAILEGGLKWIQTGLSSEDSGFLETRKYQRAEIAGLFRVPAHKIGDLEKATFSNIEHLGLEFVTDSLMPLITRIEQRVALTLLTREERKAYVFKINVNGLMRGDMTARSNFYTRMLQAGALSPNEIRELEDLNPRDGGDVYLTPLNMAVDGKDPAAPKEPGDT